MIRSFIRISTYFFFSLACAIVQMAALRFYPAFSRRFPIWYHGVCLKIIGIEVVTQGQPSPARPCLFVANHASYLDIPVLGSQIETCFVAKKEVANWPLFGLLAKLQRSLFIDRRMNKAGEGQSALEQRLLGGERIVLFPEGTSSDGTRVLPFKRALFELPTAPGFVIQPVTIVCSAVNGVPSDRVDRQGYAWFGDMTLVPHLWKFCQRRSTQVRVTFHEPLNRSAFTDRAALAAAAEEAVAQGLVA